MNCYKPALQARADLIRSNYTSEVFNSEQKGLTDKMMEQQKAIKELARLRNRHVAKLLSHLGDVPPYLEAAIKRGLSMFADDVETNIINSDQMDNQNENTVVQFLP